MPTYNYRCVNPDCLHEMERFHGMNNTPDCVCPLCESRMKKLVGAPPHKFMNPRGTMGIINRGPRGLEKTDISN